MKWTTSEKVAQSALDRQTDRQAGGGGGGTGRTDRPTEKHTDKPTAKQISKTSKFLFSYQLRSKLSDIRKKEGTFPANKSSEKKKKRNYKLQT